MYSTHDTKTLKQKPKLSDPNVMAFVGGHPGEPPASVYSESSKNDDARTGLKEEAFVLGMTEMMSRLVESKHIRNASKGFALIFSEQPFEGQDTELAWLRSDDSQVLPGQDGSAAQIMGNWYSGIVAGQRMEGWLCPALGLYFQAAPKKIYVRADLLPAGVDPIWQVPPGQRERRFVSAAPK